MEYTNVVTLHDFEGENVAIVTWFTDEQATLSDAKRVAKPLTTELVWFQMCFSSGHVSSAIPTFLVVEENTEYGKQN